MSRAEQFSEMNQDLIEVAEVPADKMDLFLSAELFNTNNIQLKTNSIPAELPLRVICNKKKLQGEPVIKLETAMGDAIRFFNNPKIMIVPRSRFSPVLKIQIQTESEIFIPIGLLTDLCH